MMKKNTKVHWKLIKAGIDTNRPILANIVVTRRCNLSCGYCFEYDKVSKPVPLATLKHRIDQFNRLKTVFVTLNGGEPLLHPNIVELTQYISGLGMIPMMNTNAHALKQEKIIGLNKAGLYGMQISCDSLEDNEVTQKSMKRLRPKLELLKGNANFIVRVNGVLGSGPPQEMLEVANIVLDYGFDFQCSFMRDSSGATIPLNKESMEVYLQIRELRNRLPFALNDNFQIPLAKGENTNWKCRAGARHFEVDENGMVHYCQPKTGFPAKKIDDYTIEDIKKHFNTKKECTAKCPVAYAHLGSRIDALRPQKIG